MGDYFKYLLVSLVVVCYNNFYAQFPFERQTPNYEIVMTMDELPSGGYLIGTRSEDYNDANYDNRKSILYKTDSDGIILDSLVMDSTLLVQVIVKNNSIFLFSDKLKTVLPHYPSWPSRQTHLLKLDFDLNILYQHIEPEFIWATSASDYKDDLFLVSERVLDTSLNRYEVIAVYDTLFNLVQRDSTTTTIFGSNIFEQQGKIFLGGSGTFPDPNNVWNNLDLAIIDTSDLSIDTLWSWPNWAGVIHTRDIIPTTDSTFIVVDDSLNIDWDNGSVRVKEFQYNGTGLDLVNAFILGDDGRSNGVGGGYEFIGVNSQGNYIIGGNSYDNNADQWAYFTDGGYTIWCVEPNGNLVWRRDMLIGEYRHLTSIFVDSNDDILIAGMFNTASGAADFGNFHVTKINADGTTTGVSELSSTNRTINVHPNPSASGVFYINEKLYNVSITDLSGRVIANFNSPDHTIDLSGSASGIYLLSGTDKKGSPVAARLVK